MTEQPTHAGRLICKIGEAGYVRQRGDWIDISEDGMSGQTFVRVCLPEDDSDPLRWYVNRYLQRGVEIDVLKRRLEDAEAFKAAVLGWRENDHPEGFCRATAEIVAGYGLAALKQLEGEKQ